MCEIRKTIISIVTCFLISSALAAPPPFKLHSRENLPETHAQKRLQSLQFFAQQRAIAKLNRFSVPRQDFNEISFDDTGDVLYIEKRILIEAAPSSASPQTSLNAADVFALHSNPGAPNVIFLDFDGHDVNSTVWNASVDTYYAAPFDRDGSPDSFSQSEVNDIAAIWHRVAEDYAAFNVDVTTQDPGIFDAFTARVLITKNKDETGQSMPHSGSGGVAYLGVWGNSQYPYYQPALIYYNNLGGGSPKYVAEAASHEMGHNLGLSHDGTSTQSYYKGHGSGLTRWGPVMGLSYNKHVTQWSKGDYADANNTQDDISIISAKLGFRADDHGDTRSTASYLYIDSSGAVASTNPESDPDNLKPENKGTVSTRSDVDVFELSSGSGQINLTVTPAWRAYTDDKARGANLDVRIALLNASGSEVNVANPADETSATIQYSAGPGTYFLSVSGAGSNNDGSTYDDYGSEGQYFISGFVPPANKANDNDSNDGDASDKDIEDNDNNDGSGASELLFIENDFTSYGGNQDKGGIVNVSGGGKVVTITGNGWKAVPYPYAITQNTILEVIFSSSHQGEIHAIGFDDNKNLSGDLIFQLYGSQRWGIQDFNNYTAGDGKKAYQIPVGKYYQGDMGYLVFSMDHDVAGASGASTFADIKVYESDAQPVNNKPVVEITNPAGSLTINSETSLNLTAMAEDKEDGYISANIQWSSNLAGKLGTGADISLTLAKGQHTITAGVADSAGKSAKDSVSVTVISDDTRSDSDNDNQQNGSQIIFNMQGFESYGGSSQDVNGTITLSNGGRNLSVAGNTWKAYPLTYNFTSNTVAEFKFSSLCKGEIHGIGFDSANRLNDKRVFQLCGSQTWGIQWYNHYAGDNSPQTFRIPVGQVVQGNDLNLIVVMDHDVSQPDAQSIFSSLRLYESTPPPPTSDHLSFQQQDFVSYGGSNQDRNGSVSLLNHGQTVTLTGNTWKAVALPTTVTPNTVMKFNFSSANQGEIHGIGLAKNTSLNGNTIFQLYGSQKWGQRSYHNYNGDGSVQTYRIPVGQIYTGSFNYLVFAMDHDIANPTGESTFSNIQLCQGC